MSHFICTTCGTQYAESDAPPAACPICEDDRQYVGSDGQKWTTLDELRAEHSSRIEPQGELLGLGSSGRVDIGQRALLVPHGDGNLLWDCSALLDDAAAAAIEERGGLDGIAISHPHYYTTMVEWARRFDCPIHLHAADERWIMRPDPAIELWDGEQLDVGDGLTLHRVGGHFPGMTVLHQVDGCGGRGTLLSGDLPLVMADRPWVTFMWSYPNMIPLPASEVERIAVVLGRLRYETLHAAFWDTEIHDAATVVWASAERYLAALREVPAEPDVASPW